MKLRVTIAALLAGLASVHSPDVHGQDDVGPAVRASCPIAPQDCGGGPCVVDFKSSANASNNPMVRQDFINAAGRPNTTLRLGPNVELDFSGLDGGLFPIRFARCTTLMSLRAFEVLPIAALPALALSPVGSSARTPSSLGPILRYGTDHENEADNPDFLAMRCTLSAGFGDGVRMSGIRVLGPSLDSQQTNETGISISRCIDIEISNMEFAGWGSAAIEIVDQEDDATQDRGSITLGPDGTPDGGRIRDPQQVRIIRNYFHHNQHPSEGGHAAGYGVNVQDGAWALVAENVFDFNRHAIAASGKAGGYDAERNLILKGGGFHGRWYNRWTHLFDVHGDAHGFLSSAGTSLKNTLCFWCEDKPPSTYDTGNAGRRFLFVANAFQFRNDYAIKIRGRPRSAAIIQQNVFPHDGLEADWGDDAISLQTKENVDLGPGNVIRVDTFGKYGVCDFDGDGVDDLFLPTGRTWWFSSFGEFQWSYLNARTERLAALRLGYFDDDGRCDVLTESNGRWEISSGGSGLKTSLGIFDARLQDVQFGRFDPSVRDSRPNVTRKTTHAFRRLPDGQWQVTSLSARDWQNVETSQLPMNKLRFGDFTGDGVTDVLAVVDGQWSISESAREPWRPLNPNLDEPMAKLQIVNLDADDNIDDVLRLDVTGTPSSLFLSTATTRLTWWRSKNGTEPWREYKKYEFKYEVSAGFTITPQFGFAGRFGVTPGGGVMVIDQNRRGRFFCHVDEPSDWMSRFAY